eukprot:1402411-Prorocentrum_lima.AAC.1
MSLEGCEASPNLALSNVLFGVPMLQWENSMSSSGLVAWKGVRDNQRTIFCVQTMLSMLMLC